MILALIVFAIMLIAQGFIIVALLNRVLLQAGQAPIELPRRQSEPEPQEKLKPRKLFGVSLTG